MDNENLLMMAVAALAGAALAGGGCTWWFMRQLSGLRKDLDKAQRAAAHTAKSARRQIRQLEKELAERPALASEPPPPSTPADAVAAKAAELAARRAELERSMEKTMLLPSSGFADTRPLE